jgi:hypothetical protein
MYIQLIYHALILDVLLLIMHMRLKLNLRTSYIKLLIKLIWINKIRKHLSTINRNTKILILIINWILRTHLFISNLFNKRMLLKKISILVVLV